MFWFSVATLAAARVPDEILLAFVVSVVAEVARPSIELTVEALSSCVCPEPLDDLPRILFCEIF